MNTTWRAQWRSDETPGWVSIEKDGSPIEYASYGEANARVFVGVKERPQLKWRVARTPD